MPRTWYPGSNRFSSSLGINPMQYESSNSLYRQSSSRSPTLLLKMQERGCENGEMLQKEFQPLLSNAQGYQPNLPLADGVVVFLGNEKVGTQNSFLDVQ
jgi:hypothetical protein